MRVLGLCFLSNDIHCFQKKLIFMNENFQASTAWLINHISSAVFQSEELVLLKFENSCTQDRHFSKSFFLYHASFCWLCSEEEGRTMHIVITQLFWKRFKRSVLLQGMRCIGSDGKLFWNVLSRHWKLDIRLPPLPILT